MNYPQDRIPEEKTQEVFTLAAQLYAQHNQSYSVKELMEAGAEAKIPPEFIQQAVEQIQLKRSQTQQLSTHPSDRSKILLISLATGILALGGLFFLAKSQVKEAPVATNPIPAQPQVGANFSKCIAIKGQNLQGANLAGADCTKADLSNTDLSGANLEGANFSGANLEKALLNGAKLQGTNLANAKLSNINLSGANLEGANLSGTDLQKANLRDAKLKGTDFAKANLKDATLDPKEINTPGVNFNGATLPDGTTHP